MFDKQMVHVVHLSNLHMPVYAVSFINGIRLQLKCCLHIINKKKEVLNYQKLFSEIHIV